jgi:hypothetical protein
MLQMQSRARMNGMLTFLTVASAAAPARFAEKADPSGNPSCVRRSILTIGKM